MPIWCTKLASLAFLSPFGSILRIKFFSHQEFAAEYVIGSLAPNGTQFSVDGRPPSLITSFTKTGINFRQIYENTVAFHFLLKFFPTNRPPVTGRNIDGTRKIVYIPWSTSQPSLVERSQYVQLINTTHELHILRTL